MNKSFNRKVVANLSCRIYEKAVIRACHNLPLFKFAVIQSRAKITFMREAFLLFWATQIIFDTR